MLVSVVRNTYLLFCGPSTRAKYKFLCLALLFAINVAGCSKQRQIQYEVDGLYIGISTSEVDDIFAGGVRIPQKFNHPELPNQEIWQYPGGTVVSYSNSGASESIKGKVLSKSGRILAKRGQTRETVEASLGAGANENLELDGKLFVSYHSFFVWYKDGLLDEIQVIDPALYTEPVDLSVYD